MNWLRGVIFDLDGTLVESTLDFDIMRKEMGFSPGQPILKTMQSMNDEKHLAVCKAVLDKHEGASAEKAKLIPGVRLLLDKLISHGIPHGIFTLNDPKHTRFLTDRLGLSSFSAVVTRDDAPLKPDPSGLKKICESWGCGPKDVIFIGDYLYDIQAGKAAGIKTMLYAQEPLPVFASEADHIISDFGSLADGFEEILTRLRGR